MTRHVLAASVGLLVLVGAGGVATGASTDAAPPSNPHGDPSGCGSCHAPGAAATEVGEALPVVPTCLSCHPQADMHPVGMAPDQVAVPAGWPLEEGLVTCATCHAEPAHGAQEARLPSPWHRGGPYAQITDFCYACHDESAYHRTDPHHPAEPGDPADDSCAACHSGIPDAGAPPAEARLRLEASDACRTCHRGEVHLGVAEHLGKPVDEAMRASLPAEVVLDPSGEVACWSCHDVHGDAADPEGKKRRPVAEGLRERALAHEWHALAEAGLIWPGGSDPAHPPLLALPLHDGALCRACHGDGP